MRPRRPPPVHPGMNTQATVDASAAAASSAIENCRRTTFHRQIFEDMNKR